MFLPILNYRNYIYECAWKNWNG